MKVNRSYQSNVFETLRTYNGQLRAFELHFRRLLNSWTLLHRKMLRPPQINQIKLKLHSELAKHSFWPISTLNTQHLGMKTRHTEWIVRIQLTEDLTLDVSIKELDLNYVHKPCTLMSVYLSPQYPPAAKQTDRKVWTETCTVLGCDEILLCDSQGRPLETNNSIFWVLELECSTAQVIKQLSMNSTDPLKGLTWYTHPSDGQILAGVTRALLIPILSSLGAQVIEQPLGPLHTQPQQYYFLTSTLKSISWVSMLDHHPHPPPSFLPLLFSLIDRYLCKY